MGSEGLTKKAVEALVSRLNGESFSVESEQLITAHDQELQIGNTRVACKYNGLDTSTKGSASHGLSVLSYVIWDGHGKMTPLVYQYPWFYPNDPRDFPGYSYITSVQPNACVSHLVFDSGEYFVDYWCCCDAYGTHVKCAPDNYKEKQG